MSFRGGRSTVLVGTAAPTAAIDIGDGFVTGGIGLASDAGHQHAFLAPTLAPNDVAAAANSGGATTPAHSDHVHAHPASQHAPGGALDLSSIYARLGATTDGVQFVAASGSDSQDGLGFGSAKATIAAAIAALPAGGGTVIIGVGLYTVTTAISIPSNVALVAHVPRTVTIRAGADIGAGAPAGWLGVLQVRDPAGGSLRSNVYLEGLIVDANAQANTPALTIQGGSGVIAADCQFRGGGGSAIATVLVLGGSTGAGPGGLGSDGVAFDRCEIGPSSTAGLVFGGGTGSATPTVTNAVLARCRVHDNAHDGVNAFMGALRTIRGVLIDACRFDNNGTAATAGNNMGHVNDTARYGWADLEVRGCYFGQAGSDYCGGIGDHGGWNVHVHDNTFRLGVTTIWPIAIGNTNTLGATRRSRFVWIEDNYFEGNNSFDYDSSDDVFIRRNVFYRVNGRPVGAFGDHLRNTIEDNSFIECGQGSPANFYEQAGISIGSGGFTIRRNVFVDEQATHTMLAGVVEIAGGVATGPLVYDDNNFAGIGTPLTEVPTYDTVRIVKRNKGINPKGAIVVGLGASPYTYTAGESPETFMVRSSGSGVNITKGGVQIVSNAADGTGTNTAAISLEPREQIVLTYPGPTPPTCYTDVR